MTDQNDNDNTLDRGLGASGDAQLDSVSPLNPPKMVAPLADPGLNQVSEMPTMPPQAAPPLTDANPTGGVPDSGGSSTGTPAPWGSDGTSTTDSLPPSSPPQTDNSPPADGGPYKTAYPGQSVASGGVHTYGPDDQWQAAHPGPWDGHTPNANQVDNYGNVYVPVQSGLWQGGAIDPNQFPGKSKGQNSQLWGGPTSDGAPDWFKNMVDAAANMPDGPDKTKRIKHIMDSILTPGMGINSHDVHYANAAFGFDDGHGGLDPKDISVKNNTPAYVPGGPGAPAPSTSDSYSPSPPVSGLDSNKQ